MMDDLKAVRELISEILRFADYVEKGPPVVTTTRTTKHFRTLCEAAQKEVEAVESEKEDAYHIGIERGLME